VGQGSDAAVSLAALIAAQRAEHGIPVAGSCRALGVSQAWFHKWRRGDRSPRRKRRAALAAMVVYLFAKSKSTYGSPRITADLRALGWRVSKNTVAKLMAEQGLVARRTRRRRGTTRPDKSARKAPDGLRRNFAPPPAPNVAWVGDLTEIPTDEGKLQLAAVLDLHSRRCVGFAMGIHHDAALARAALCVAIAVRGGAVAGVLFHTDQGSEYTANLFVEACRSAGVTQSMGRHRLSARQGLGFIVHLLAWVGWELVF
jgi:putative transposase